MSVQPLTGIKQHMDWLKDHPEIQSVQAALFDLNGVMRGKRIPATDIEKVLSGGVRMPLSVTGVDIWGQDIANSELVFEGGDADGICEHTGRGLVPVTWTKKPTLLLPLWLSQNDGSPFSGDPRRALEDVLLRYKARGLTPVVATELEFYLLDASTDRPMPPLSPLSGNRLGSDGVLSLDELEHFEGFLNDVYEACRVQGIPADAAISENGAGQFEINMTHCDDPLRAADDAVLFKRLVRGIARKHGFGATFMAKPYGDRSGSGFHVHFSLLDINANNVFDDGSEEGSNVLKHAVGGLLETMAELTLTFAPHFNSFRRLTPDSHAPTAIAWGYENRHAAIRIPAGPKKARRIEHRVAGADANPYLVLASVLGGALYGIESQIVPAGPLSGNGDLPEKVQLPTSWEAAINAFSKGERVAQIYSMQLQTMFVGCKRQELTRFSRHVSEFEYHSYLDVV